MDKGSEVIKKSVLICDNLWTKNSVDKKPLWMKVVTDGKRLHDDVLHISKNR